MVPCAGVSLRGAFHERRAFPEPLSGAFPEPPSGAFPEPLSGAFPEPLSGARPLLDQRGMPHCASRQAAVGVRC